MTEKKKLLGRRLRALSGTLRRSSTLIVVLFEYLDGRATSVFSFAPNTRQELARHGLYSIEVALIDILERKHVIAAKAY